MLMTLSWHIGTGTIQSTKTVFPCPSRTSLARSMSTVRTHNLICLSTASHLATAAVYTTGLHVHLVQKMDSTTHRESSIIEIFRRLMSYAVHSLQRRLYNHARTAAVFKLSLRARFELR
jgi:hypothetical protein